MENFVKISANDVAVVNGVVTNVFMSRSLVLCNTKTGTLYNIAAKCRNTDEVSVAKAMAKAVLAALRTAQGFNTTKAAAESKKRVTNPMVAALGCHEIYVTDKDGKLLQNAGIKLKNGEALRSVFRFTKSQPIYQLCVEQGKDWSDVLVVNAMKWWSTAAIEQLDKDAKFDEALEKAANSNEAEAKAEAKAETQKTTKKAA